MKKIAWTSLALALMSLQACSWKKRLPDPPSESQSMAAQNTNENDPLKKPYVEPTRESRMCESAKEYITALEYLRSEESYALNEKEAQRIAGLVAQGCTNAANRFIKVTRTLSRSNVSGRNAIEAGLKFSKKSSKEMYAFLTIFSQCFLEEGLDMDIDSSLKIAHSLSNEFGGDSYLAVKDFQDIVEYCMNHEDFHFEKADCGKLAAKVSKQGENSKEVMSKPFIAGFEFLVSEKGPHLDVEKALHTAEELVAISPKAISNYVDAYLYGVSSKGLSFPSDRAHVFAFEIASYTGPEKISAVEKEKPNTESKAAENKSAGKKHR